MDPERLLTQSLREHPQGKTATRIMAAALEAVDPDQAVRKHLKRTGNRLKVGDRVYPLEGTRRIFVVGAGKAGAPMAHAAAEILGDRLSEGVIVVKEGYRSSPSEGRIEILEAGHPVPDARGVQATRRILELVSQAGAEDLVLCLISGGGSALLTAPEEGISLQDLQSLTGLLLASGATINEINALRKHLDAVKGGQLARRAAPAQVASLILSDVVGDPLDVIASGPTVPDRSTFAEAYGILEKYDLLDQSPQKVVLRLEAGKRGKLPETPKAGDELFRGVHNAIIGSNHAAAEAALRTARDAGFNAALLTTYLQGEARHAGPILAALLRQIAASGQPLGRPACLIAGGETTVTLKGKGLGGRNQELALSAVRELAGLASIALIALATDGGDGPTDAAGAVATGETLGRARQQGLAPEKFLAENDSYHFFEPLGDLLAPGPTQTNVNDLTFLFAFH